MRKWGTIFILPSLLLCLSANAQGIGAPAEDKPLVVPMVPGTGHADPDDPSAPTTQPRAQAEDDESLSLPDGINPDSFCGLRPNYFNFGLNRDGKFEGFKDTGTRIDPFTGEEVTFDAPTNTDIDVPRGQQRGYFVGQDCKANFRKAEIVSPDLDDTVDSTTAQVQEEIRQEQENPKPLDLDDIDSNGDGILYSGAEIQKMLAELLLIQSTGGVLGAVRTPADSDPSVPPISPELAEQLLSNYESALTQAKVDPDTAAAALREYRTWLNVRAGKTFAQLQQAGLDLRPVSGETGVQFFDEPGAQTPDGFGITTKEKVDFLVELLQRRKEQLEDREEAAKDARDNKNNKPKGGAGSPSDSPQQQSPSGGSPSGGGNPDGGQAFKGVEPMPYNLAVQPMQGLPAFNPLSEECQVCPLIKDINDKAEAANAAHIEKMRGLTTQMVGTILTPLPANLTAGFNNMIADTGSKLPQGNLGGVGSGSKGSFDDYDPFQGGSGSGGFTDFNI